MRVAESLVLLSLAIIACKGTAQTTTAAQAPQAAPSFNLTEVIGNLTARQDACSQYTLPAPFNNATNDTSFLGPYLSTLVGQDNYTYHQFGPLNGGPANHTLVLIPGTESTSNVWTPDLLQILAYDRSVVTFDLPGVGSPSTQPSDQQTLDSISQSLLGFFKALGLSQPDLLGWSWGGTIALYLGAFYGNSIGNLVIVASTSGGEGYFEGEYLASNASTNVADLNALLFPNTVDGEEGLCKLDAFEMIMPGPNLTSSELRNQSIVVNSAWANNTLSQQLGNVLTPTLLIAGELDVVTDFQSTLYLLENINGSVLLDSPSAGHGVLFQETESLAPAIVEFLDYYDGDDSTYVYYYDYSSG